MTQQQNQFRLTQSQAAQVREQMQALSSEQAVMGLLQEALRSGATRVYVRYDSDSKMLTVQGNGTGIMKPSSWASRLEVGLPEADQTFGLTYLAALCRGSKATVCAVGEVVSFAAESLLLGEVASVRVADAWACGTIVLLQDFAWDDALSKLQDLVSGFPLQVFFDGEEIERPFALNGSEVAGALGKYLLRGQMFDPSRVRVYVDGICVHAACSGIECVGSIRIALPANVAHLDAQRFALDAVTPELIDQINLEIRGMCEARLLEMKKELAPVDFCQRAYSLALSLGRLDIFNDVDCVPTAWLGWTPCLPSTANRHLLPLDLDRIAPQFQTETPRDLVVRNSACLASLSDFKPWREGAGNQLAWMFAHLAKASQAVTRTDGNHWVRSAAQITDASNVTLNLVRPRTAGAIVLSGEPARTVKVVVCDGASLRIAACTRWADAAFFAQVEGDLSVVVPELQGECFAKAGLETVRQFRTYSKDGIFQREEAGHDVAAINSVVHAVAVEAAGQRLAMMLSGACKDAPELLGQSFRVDFAGDGEPTAARIQPGQEGGPVAPSSQGGSGIADAELEWVYSDGDGDACAALVDVTTGEVSLSDPSRVPVDAQGPTVTARLLAGDGEVDAYYQRLDDGGRWLVRQKDLPQLRHLLATVQAVVEPEAQAA